MEQTKAFRSKIWQLHVSARRRLLASGSSDTERNAVYEQSSSREPDHSIALRPFKDRIRPGMVVKWTPRSDQGFPKTLAGGTTKALVLCPTDAVESTVKDFLGNEVNTTRSDGGDTGKSKRYLCSMITPGPMSETYVLRPWQQVVVDTEMMVAEVCMEYDEATRYYYMVI